MPIRWKDGADKNLRGQWGKGSERTDKRVRRNQRELQLAALQPYSIVGLFERWKFLQLRTQDTSLGVDGEKDVPRACSPPPDREKLEQVQKIAAAKLAIRAEKKVWNCVKTPRFFSSSTSHGPEFLVVTVKTSSVPGTGNTVHSFGRTGRMIVKWAKSWVRE